MDYAECILAGNISNASDLFFSPIASQTHLMEFLSSPGSDSVLCSGFKDFDGMDGGWDCDSVWEWGGSLKFANGFFFGKCFLAIGAKWMNHIVVYLGCCGTFFMFLDG